ncbi:hydrolase [Lactiplantibacillus paraplantarum]|uniref:sugar-phosphatase n=1 Tax=Lactiplantibacillus paraplantarum TaxID=60520 RepID=UPI000513EA4B|nr:sugar-phosphatase [Lactiplantibacillus paraplantarum]ALO05408.1 hydrolase [Lactiplantibacillus paraplantarum]KGE74738.1 hydrolase [Lactiplantibacillus paraplantarum]OAX76656.1 hydrolase [Lactiplantibacillus plantarum]RDG09545.1 sugar-phosphatase [Lactiplantibacillus paraplantarum]
MENIKMIAIDIDGTLVNSKKQVTLRVKQAIKMAKEKKIKVVICTGRPLTGVKALLQELELDAQDDQYVVCFGGAATYTTSGELIDERPISYEDYIDLEALARKLRLHFHAVSEDRLYTANRNIGDYTLYEANLVSMGISYRTPEEMRNIKLIKSMYVDEPEVLDAAIKQQKLFEPLKKRVNLTKSAPFYYEANANGVSKDNALQVLCEKLSLTAANVMAIGDEANDLSMIKFAGHGVAMGNAIPEVKQVADEITVDNEHDGVAVVIEKALESK